ncbi:MAG: hypothetical protein COB60_05910 [Flavobacteriaceae bacterium]|nr:MAG: hypothetical protein COB60_05910 [Flavobacteriaceae bacterium]
MKIYIKNIIITCFVALGLVACSEDEIDTFSGIDGLYFQWSIEGPLTLSGDFGTSIDSIAVSFAYDLPEVTDAIYLLPVKVLGSVSSIDRQFSIEVLPESTGIEGVDFTLPSSLFIPADSITAMVPITLLRTPAMKNEEVLIKIGLVPNEHFVTDYYESTENIDTKEPLEYDTFKLAVSDMLTKPKFWSPILDYYLGDFSAKKLILYAQVNNIPIPNWNDSPPSDIATFFGRKNVLKAYLIDQKNDGTPVLEDDGTEMKLGPYA